MLKENLISGIEEVEKIARASRFERMLSNPFKYTLAILFRKFFYSRTEKEIEVISKTFFNADMNILLPSSTDIYLAGGKSHDSEIRLAKFLIKNLNTNDTFIDVGAHYGYFSLLASTLVGVKGKIIAFEAAPATFRILEKNKSKTNNVQTYNFAVSDTNNEVLFFEFPNLYSEYNTLDANQFENQKWFDKSKAKKLKIKAVTLDEFLLQKNYRPKIIKIDVEGAEFKVLNGANKYLQHNSPIIVMEYLSDTRGNKSHIRAERFLKSLGFSACLINNQGAPKTVNDIGRYFKINKIESDNIVFVKNKNGN